MKKDNFYITTSIAYTNAPSHIGYALELIQADVLARYQRQKLGADHVWFLTGTDEHGTKIARAAEAAGKSPHGFVDDISAKYQELTKVLNISNDDFIRTTDQDRHWPAAWKIWDALVEKGDLYKKSYEGLYCVGHEAFIKKSDLVDDICPLHKTKPEVVKEENWFFRLTKYKKTVEERIRNKELRIIPESRENEILNLFDDAEDISFSRPIESLKWGIPVPNDPGQVMYVWADALTNYVSALGWASGQELYKKFWPADVHLIGKDILRFHAMYWPAMLLSAELPLPKSILVHGFITVDGQKMSKSIGNVIDPLDMVESLHSKVGSLAVDAIRYFLLREIPSGSDGDFSWTKFKDRYNGELANGLGNLIQRVATLVESNLMGELTFGNKELGIKNKGDTEYEKAIEDFRLHDAVGEVWKLVGEANKYIDEQKPWAQIKDQPEEFLKTMTTLVAMIHHIAYLLVPFMPDTAKKIAEIFGDNLGYQEIPEDHKFVIKKGEGLFPRLG